MNTKSNDPALWLPHFPQPKPQDHKYDRGMAVIYGAPKMTGATRLAATACARIGAGLVKVMAPQGTADIYRVALPAHIIVDEETEFSAVDDPHCRAVLLGPGCPLDKMRFGPVFSKIMDDSHSHIHGVVLDAGAFLMASGAIREFREISNELRVVVTPHEGEFHAVFKGSREAPEVMNGAGKEDWAHEASRVLNATVLLKGAQTVITNGSGNIILHDQPLPQLATAGTGDVLAGMITGLIAQGMPVQEASSAAVWIHTEAAKRFGGGMVASDLPDLIPAVLQSLFR